MRTPLRADASQLRVESGASRRLGRRRLLGLLARAAAVAVAAPLLPARSRAAAEAALPDLCAWAPPDALALRRGLALGAHEAAHTARLVGRGFALALAEAPPSGDSDAAPGAILLSALGPDADRALAARYAAPLLLPRPARPGEAAALGSDAFFVASSLERRLAALLAALPEPRRWALLVDAEDERAPLRAHAEAALVARGVRLVADGARAGRAPDDALAALLRARPDALLLAVPAAHAGAALAASAALAPQLRVASLEAPAEASLPAPLVFAADWYAGLERYGAAQLDERFARRFGAPMDGPAWAGWLAAKLAGEVLLRGSGPLGARLRAVRSDGHVGRPLGFDTSSRHLDPPVRVLAAAPGRPARAIGAS